MEAFQRVLDVSSEMVTLHAPDLSASDMADPDALDFIMQDLFDSPLSEAALPPSPACATSSSTTKA